MIYLIILIINIALLAIYRSGKRFWIVTIPIWTLLLSSFCIWRIYNEKQINALESAYWKKENARERNENKNWQGAYENYKEIQDSKRIMKKYNSVFLNSIFLQSILTFIAQVIGYKVTTEKKTYRINAIIFGVILAINLFLEFLMAIVPTGPLL